MRKRIIAICSVFLLSMVIFACGQEETPTEAPTAPTEPSETVKRTLDPDVVSFGDYLNDETFINLPAMLVPGTGIAYPREVGDGNMLIDVSGTSLENYKSYLNLLKDNGFIVAADNGEQGLYDSVYNVSLIKDDLLVTVVWLSKLKRTGIIVTSDNRNISPHLDPAMKKTGGEGQTTLTMLACTTVHEGGTNCFVLQLKNGHFLVSDGGNKEDAAHLVNYLESLTPEGEKPVVEGWFLTHGHSDHVAAIIEIATNTSLNKRVVVDGIYFNCPSEEIQAALDESGYCKTTLMCPDLLTASNGERTKLYRTVEGQRYYFDEVEISVILSSEWTPLAEMSGDLNDSTTYTVWDIEGQKVLFSGDGQYIEQLKLMEIYDPEPFNFAIMTVSHHGFNNSKPFTDFITVDTCLLPHFSLVDPIYPESLEYLLRYKSKHWYSYYNGSVKITFPYTSGKVEILPTDYVYKGATCFRQVEPWEPMH